MSIEGPFGEKTAIIRPNPGGRLQEPGEAPADPYAGRAPAPAVAPGSSAILDLPGGIDPLVEAAAPILALVSRLATTITQTDVQELRQRLRGAFATFEKRAAAGSLRPELQRAAHYALCATVDDVAANTPWGAQNVWASQSMARVFHNDTSGGERFFDLLGHFERDPESYFEVIELFYLCLSLGFQGRLRILPEGAADLATIRGRLHRIIRRRRGEVAAELSPHWRGIAAPHRRFGVRVPLWVVGASALAVLVLVFVGFRIALGTDSDGLFDQVAGMPKIVQPRLQAISVPPPPPPPVPRRVAGFLEPEIREGLVTVHETGQEVLVRLHGTGLFKPGSATLEDRFLPVIERIGAALRDEPGPVTVIGYTDNQPIHTVEFPSNYELSLARAGAVRAQLAQALGGQRDRIATDGRADSEPLADNSTPQGREMNRRIEILVFRTKANP